MNIGIVSYGAYIPRFRISARSIAHVWGVNPETITKGLGIEMKSVPGPDEDVITISVEAARSALARVDIDPSEIGAVYVGSESHPYAVKPTATIVADAIMATPNMTAADFEFACKAGTAAIQTCMGLVGSDMVRYGLAVGADTSQGAPGDALEYSAAAGGAAYIIGSEKKDTIIAKINRTRSYTTDTPDFWRREGQRYPSHGGRFTGIPAYFKHVVTCSNLLMEEIETKPSDYQFIVLHQPNGKFPVRAARQLGFTKEQVKTGLLSPRIGNTYSGAVPLGLAAILDVCRPGDRIFVIAYGSGAGSDAFDIEVTEAMADYRRGNAPLVSELIAAMEMVDYSIYAKFRNKFNLRGGD